MTVYRGDNNGSFKVEKKHNSRYGFPALFFSTKEELARMYATYKAREGGEPYVYAYDIAHNMQEIDFKGRESYSLEFVNLIHDLKRSGVKAVRITNVFDYPSQDFKGNNSSDVVAVFDLSLINNGRII